MAGDRSCGAAAERAHGLQARGDEGIDREKMTSAAIVTPGQTMAMTPTMTPRTPSRINEVDVDLNMTGIPFFSALARRAVFGAREKPVNVSRNKTVAVG